MRIMAVKLIKTPIYQQLNKALRELIHTGEFEKGAKFLTEREIGQRFEVSRTTANKALSSLVAEGVLEFKKGIGTFVSSKQMYYDLGSLVSFTRKAASANKEPLTKVVYFEKTSALAIDRNIAQALELKNDEPVYYMKRIRYGDKQPLILERRYVTASFCPDLETRNLEDSIYDLWTNAYELNINGVDQTIKAIAMDKEDAKLLTLKEGAAGLLITGTGYIEGAIPLWFENTLYRGDTYEFKNTVQSNKSVRPAFGDFSTIQKR